MSAPTQLTPRLLPPVLAISGASLLGMEVLAVRVLSPYFGNTSFAVSSVLTVILAGLAVGYTTGGRLAERRPSLATFFLLYALAGVALLLTWALGEVVLPRLGYRLPLTWGPLVSSLLLFALPAVLMGMLSPYALRLVQAEVPERGVGRNAGSLLFWSTVGNIVGGIAMGFVLIPGLGVRQLLLGSGFLLLVIGAVALVVVKKTKAAAVLGLLAVVLPLPALGLSPRAPKLLHESDGLYQRIRIHDGVLSGRSARFLLLDRSVSGAVHLDDRTPASAYAHAAYAQRRATPKLERVLVIGGGVYEVPRLMLAEPKVIIDVVEIDPALPKLAEEHFFLPRDARLVHHIGDGRRFLHDSKRRYDFIFGDAYYSLYSTPWHLVTREFFELVHERLEERGVFVANFIGDAEPGQGGRVLPAELKTLLAVFDEVRAYPTREHSYRGPQNVIAVACKGRCREVPGAVRPLDVAALSQGGQLLTDDHAPVEALVLELFR